MNPREGVWDLRGQVFIRSCPPIQRMMVLIFEREQYFPRNGAEDSVMQFVRGLMSVGLSVTNQRPPIEYVPAMQPDMIAKFIKDTAQRIKMGGPPQLLVCYLKGKGKSTDEYAAIKRFGDLDVGVATQCLSIQKVMGDIRKQKPNPQCESDSLFRFGSGWC